MPSDLLGCLRRLPIQQGCGSYLCWLTTSYVYTTLLLTLGISQSAVSHHLRLMRDMRVVKNRKVGRMVYYYITSTMIIIHDLFDRGVEHVVHA